MIVYWSVVFALLSSPWPASAALFPSKTQVKMINSAGFRKAMKENVTSVVAFVAPWCGYCKAMAPEYSKAADALAPMVPLYAVDCDDVSNKPLCSDQGVQGFPTVKVYPRGGRSKPLSYDSGERTANSFFYWVTRNIPHGVKRLRKNPEIPGWANKHTSRPRALLLTSSKDIPLMWKALGNKYKDTISFGIVHDENGDQAVNLGAEEIPTTGSKVLIYPPGSQRFVRFEGRLKFKPLDGYLGSVADGTILFPSSHEEPEELSATPRASDPIHGDATRSETQTQTQPTATTLISDTSRPSAHVEQDEPTEETPIPEKAKQPDTGSKSSIGASRVDVVATEREVGLNNHSEHVRDEL